MHQFPRTTPVTASPAQSARTNSIRTNNSREQFDSARAMSAGRVTPTFSDETATTVSTGSEERDPVVQRLNQTIQVELNLQNAGIKLTKR